MARSSSFFRKMKINPPPGTPLLAVGLLTVGAIGTGVYFLTQEPAPSNKKGKSCKPFKFTTTVVRAAIEVEIADGETDPLKIAMDVATDLFGTYPNGGEVNYPPNPNDTRKGVQCVWEKVLNLVAVVIDEKGINEGPVVGPIDIDVVDPYDPGYPWEKPALETNNYPTPGTFAATGDESAFDYSQGIGAMLAAAINSAIAMGAAMGHDTSTAKTWMSDVGGEKYRDLVKQAAVETFCSKFNDGLFGRVYQGDKKSSWNLYGWLPNGRSPLMLPQHNDVLSQMSIGETPKRAITLTAGTYDGKFSGHISGQGRRDPSFWIPAFNLAKLAGPKPAVTTAGMTWSDGSSTREPPPIVQRMGLDLSGVALPGGPGCK